MFKTFLDLEFFLYNLHNSHDNLRDRGNLNSRNVDCDLSEEKVSKEFLQIGGQYLYSAGCNFIRW